MTGSFSEGEALFAQLAGIAARRGDAIAGAHADVGLLHMKEATSPYGWPALAESEADRLFPIVQAAGDERGLALTWFLRLKVHWWRSECGKAIAAAERVRFHAHRVGDGDLEWIATGIGLGACLFGPVTPADGIKRCEDVVAKAGESTRLEFAALSQLAVFRAMEGRFEEARALINRMREINTELGPVLNRTSIVAERLGLIESLAGDYGAAERAEREQYARLQALGDKGILSTCAARLAGYIYEQGRYDEAEELSRMSEDLAATEDYPSQVGWRITRARVLARRGDAGAERVALDAVELAERTDAYQMHGDAELALADVLRLSGDADGAVAAAERALALYERKGIVPLVERTRARLKEWRQS